jgi:hypothetical protein
MPRTPTPGALLRCGSSSRSRRSGRSSTPLGASLRPLEASSGRGQGLVVRRRGLIHLYAQRLNVIRSKAPHSAGKPHRRQQSSFLPPTQRVLMHAELAGGVPYSKELGGGIRAHGLLLTYVKVRHTGGLCQLRTEGRHGGVGRLSRSSLSWTTVVETGAAAALLTTNPSLVHAAARELAFISLDEALRILVVFAERQDPRFQHAAARFAARVMMERRLTPAEAHRVLALAESLPTSPDTIAQLLRRFCDTPNRASDW